MCVCMCVWEEKGEGHTYIYRERVREGQKGREKSREMENGCELSLHNRCVGVSHFVSE